MADYQHGHTATLTITDGQMATLMTLFEPLVDAFIEKVAQRTRQLIDEAKPRFYSRKEVAELLHVSLVTVHHMINAGVLQPEKVGKRTLFAAQVVDEGIKDGTLRKFSWSKKGGLR